eukprot:Clim_evm14s3 gene=Clim_evmTU14s3
MSLWVDKYRPREFSQCSFHDDINDRMKCLLQAGGEKGKASSSPDFPHLLVYGPSGAGKKTRIMCLLRGLYGPGVERMKMDTKTYQTAGGTKFEVTSIASNYHIELSPAEAGNNDRIVIQEALKEIASAQQLDAGQQKAFKVVVLNEVDALSRNAQAALRRTMEKYASTCRLILYCTNVSKVIAPIRSRCLGVRIPAPTDVQISSILHDVADAEGFDLPEDFARKVSAASGRNARRALLMLEAARMRQYPFKANQEVPQPDWEIYVQGTAKLILAKQDPEQLLLVRGRLYEILAHCIPVSLIIRKLVEYLSPRLDDQLKVDLMKWAAFYEHRASQGSKEIFHLEAFVAKFMALYKKFMFESFADF